MAKNLQSNKTFLTLELGQYRKSSSNVFSTETVAASSDCCKLENATIGTSFGPASGRIAS